MQHTNNKVTYAPYSDYVQSANTLFHFMKKQEYLDDLLVRRALVPRYCIETIDYLNVHNGYRAFSEVAILQKCFCDIPFHKLADTFSVTGTGENFNSLSSEDQSDIERNNTHFSFYGEYAVGFSKNWGEEKKLQPVHYLNNDSQYATNFISLLEKILNEDDIPEEYAQDVLNRLAYLKPLKGIMQRTFTREENDFITVDIYKNFHDEREWRYVPKSEDLTSLGTGFIIANPNILPLSNEISDSLKSERFRDIWLDFSYDDIRYIIVPDAHQRIKTIKTINELPTENFIDQEDIDLQKNILMSKILVLNEIRKDW